jgi:hypothetical protein
MLHKLALAVGGLASAGILAAALAAAGFAPVAPVSPVVPVTDAANTDTPAARTPQTTTVTENVYVEPTPKQRVIRISKPAIVGLAEQPVRSAVHNEGEGSEHDDGAGYD